MVMAGERGGKAQKSGKAVLPFWQFSLGSNRQMLDYHSVFEIFVLTNPCYQVLWNFTVLTEQCRSLQCLLRCVCVHWRSSLVELSFQVLHKGSSVGLNYISGILTFIMF